jgi:hypothetical protein
MTSAPGLSCAVLQLLYAKACSGGTGGIIDHLMPSGYPASAASGRKHWTPLRGMKPGQPRFALKPLAVQQGAWTPDSSPDRNVLAVLPRQALSYSSASRTEPTGGEDSCLRRQPSKDAAALPFDEWQRGMKKGSGQLCPEPSWVFEQLLPYSKLRPVGVVQTARSVCVPAGTVTV